MDDILSKSLLYICPHGFLLGLGQHLEESSWPRGTLL